MYGCAPSLGELPGQLRMSLTGRVTSWSPQAESHPNFSCFITGGQTVEEASSAPKNDLVPEDRALGTTESLEPNAMDGEAEV